MDWEFHGFENRPKSPAQHSCRDHIVWESSLSPLGVHKASCAPSSIFSIHTAKVSQLPQWTYSSIWGQPGAGGQNRPDESVAAASSASKHTPYDWILAPPQCQHMSYISHSTSGFDFIYKVQVTVTSTLQGLVSMGQVHIHIAHKSGM